MKKYTTLGIIILLLGGTYYFLEGYKFTGFYNDCKKISVGMSAGEVSAIMSKYIDDKSKYEFSSNALLEGQGFYLANLVSNNQCSISISNGVVSKVFFLAE